ncbi:hypothetical protein [Nostoc sp.]|uniref:hypothetical protein n=1 Tax=Nostoc sp. TaxID=1180 RepID=UPI002FF857A7
MVETEATNFLRVLLQQDAEHIQTWLRMVWAKQQQVPEKFNWLGLAEVSTSNAQELAWALPYPYDKSICIRIFVNWYNY